MVGTFLPIEAVATGQLQAIEVSGQPSIAVEANFLFSADFARQGDDLRLRGEEGGELLLRGYFAQTEPPQLESVEGARLSPDTVESLAGPEYPVAYAQVGGAQTVQPIGEVSGLNGIARVQHSDGTRENLSEGDPIYQGDVVSTGVGSELGIVFVDDTVFSLSSNARMVIDELIYNPESTANSMGISLVQGTFVFVTGQVAPTGGIEVDTPVGTIGIRGTTVGVQIATFGGASRIANLVNPETGEHGNFAFDNLGGSTQFTLANHFLAVSSISANPGSPRVAPSQFLENAFGRNLNSAVDIQRTLGQDRSDDSPQGPNNQEGKGQDNPGQDLLDALLNQLPIETAAGGDQALGEGSHYIEVPWGGIYVPRLKPQGTLGEENLQFRLLLLENEVSLLLGGAGASASVSPSAALALSDGIGAIKEDSQDNLVTFTASAGDTGDELTSLVILLPGFATGDVDITQLNLDLAGLGSAVVSEAAGVTTITIIFLDSADVQSFASSFTLDAPLAQDDADLSGIQITAFAKDAVDPSVTGSGGTSGTIVVDAVLDEAGSATQGAAPVAAESAGAQAIGLDLTLGFVSAGFAGSGDGGTDTDGSEAVSAVTVTLSLSAGTLVLGAGAPAGSSITDNGGGSYTVTVADPGDYAAAIAALQVAVPAGYEGTVTGTIAVTTEEMAAGDGEPDLSDNSKTVTNALSITVTGGAVVPVIAFGPPIQQFSLAAEDASNAVLTIKEDSEDNVVEFTAGAGDPTDELTSVVIELPGVAAGDVDVTQLNLDLVGLGSAVVSEAAGTTTITITFLDGADVQDFSGFFTLDTPVADSDADLTGLTITAHAKDSTDPAATGSATAAGTFAVDAVLDEAGSATQGAAPVVAESAGAQAIGLDLTLGFVSAGFAGSGAGGTDTDGSEAVSAVTVTLSAGTLVLDPGAPAGSSLSDNGGGSYTVTVADPGDYAAAIAALQVSVPAGYEGTVTGTIAVTTQEAAAGGLEDDTADNLKTLTGNFSATVTGGAVAPTASIGLPAGTDAIKEDSENNVIEFTASANNTTDELTSVVIELPGVAAGDVDVTQLNLDLVGLGSAVVSQDGGTAVITITFLDGADVQDFSGFFTLDAPVADSDADLTGLTITAHAKDSTDPAATGSDGDSTTVVVDAVLDRALELGAAGETLAGEDAGAQTLSLDLDSSWIAPFAGSGDGGVDGDGSETTTVTLTLDAALPAGAVLSSTAGTVSATADPLVWTVTGPDLEAAVDGLQVEVPGGFQGTISGTLTSESREANTPEGAEASSGGEPDETDNVTPDAVSFTVTVAAGAVAPTASIGLPAGVDAIKEDSTDNQVNFTASANDATDELTSVVIELPGVAAGDVDVTQLNVDLVGIGSAVVSQDSGTAVITITFLDDAVDVQDFSGFFTLDAPVADSDADLAGITITAYAKDITDPATDGSGGDSTTIVVDAVLDEAGSATQGAAPAVAESAGTQAIGLDLTLGFVSAGFAGSGAGGTDDDGSEAVSAVTVTLSAGTLVLAEAGAPAGSSVTDNGGGSYTVNVADPGDYAAAIAALQVAVPAGYEGTVTGTIAVTTEEAAAGGLEDDTADNLKTLMGNFSATVTGGAVAPTASIGLPAGVDAIKEDSSGNQVNFTASANDATDELTSVVIELPGVAAGDVDVALLNVDLVGIGSAVVSQVGGTAVITITFLDDAVDVQDFSGFFTLDAPVEDSDADLAGITITAYARDSSDPATDGSGGDSTTLVVDAVADGGPHESVVQGDDDGDVAGLSVSVTVGDDGGDADTVFEPGETGSVTVTATFDDFSDGSEVHTVTVFMPAGFTYDAATVTGMPAGTTIGDGDPTKIVFTVPSDSVDGTGSFTATFEVTNVSASDGTATFDAEARAVEQNTNADPPLDIEDDTTDNVAIAESSDDATVASITAPTVVLDLAGTDSCIEEDSLETDPDNLVTLTATPPGDDLLTQIVITGLQSDWSYDLTGLGGDGITVDDSVAGQVTITFDTPLATIYSGAFGVQPPADSDIDHPTITATATVVDPADGLLSTTGENTLDIAVDANADAGSDAVGGVDDGDASELALTVSVEDDGTDGDSVFTLGESGIFHVTASFDDYLDGSETHSITVTAPSGFSIDAVSGSLPAGVTVTNSSDGEWVFDVATVGTASGTVSFDLIVTNETNVSGGHDFSVTVQAEETATQEALPEDVECDPDDNLATLTRTATAEVIDDTPSIQAGTVLVHDESAGLQSVVDDDLNGAAEDDVDPSLASLPAGLGAILSGLSVGQADILGVAQDTLSFSYGQNGPAASDAVVLTLTTQGEHSTLFAANTEGVGDGGPKPIYLYQTAGNVIVGVLAEWDGDSWEDPDTLDPGAIMPSGDYVTVDENLATVAFIVYMADPAAPGGDDNDSSADIYFVQSVALWNDDPADPDESDGSIANEQQIIGVAVTDLDSDVTNGSFVVRVEDDGLAAADDSDFAAVGGPLVSGNVVDGIDAGDGGGPDDDGEEDTLGTDGLAAIRSITHDGILYELNADGDDIIGSPAGLVSYLDGVLTIDTAEGGSFTIVMVDTASNGAIGDYAYTPPASGPLTSLSETFDYDIEDGDGDGDRSGATLIVNLDDLPRANDALLATHDESAGLQDGSTGATASEDDDDDDVAAPAALVVAAATAAGKDSLTAIGAIQQTLDFDVGLDDGAGSGVSYDTSVGGTDSGLEMTATGKAVYLYVVPSSDGDLVLGVTVTDAADLSDGIQIGEIEDVVFSLHITEEVIRAGGDSATSTFIQYAAVVHGDAGTGADHDEPLAAALAIDYVATDDDLQTDSATISIQIEDAGPSITSNGDVVVDEADLATTASVPVSFSVDFGSDGGDLTGITLQSVSDGETAGALALQTTDGTPVLTAYDAATQTLIGYRSGGDPAVFADRVFTLHVNDDGIGSFTLLQAVKHPDAGETGADDPLDLTFQVTVKDGDNDTDSATITVTLQDDEPAVTVVGGEGSVLALALNLDETIDPDGNNTPENGADFYNGGIAESESNPGTSNGDDDDIVDQLAVDGVNAIGRLTTTAGDLADLFSVTEDAGADGEKSQTYSFAFLLSAAELATTLSVTAEALGGNPGPLPGDLTIYLFQVDDSTVEGRVGGELGPVALRISLEDPDDTVLGDEAVTVEQFLAIDHGEDGNTYDTELPLYLTSGTLSVELTSTLTDGDDDGASDDHAVVLIDSTTTFVSIDDDGPRIDSVMDAIMANQAGNVAYGTYQADFGTDGLDFLSLAFGGDVDPLYDFASPIDVGGGLFQINVTHTADSEKNFSFYFETVSDPATTGGSGGAVFHAYFDEAMEQEFFILTVNADGTYSFDLIDNSAITQTTIDFTDNEQVPAGNFAQLVLTGVTVDSLSDSGTNQNVNTSSNGLAAGTNQNTEQGETIIFLFDEVQKFVAFDVQKGTSGTQVYTLTLAFYDETGGHLGDRQVSFDLGGGGDFETITILQGTSDPNPNDTTIFVDFAFAQMDVEYTSSDGGGGFNLNNLSFGVESTVDDITFQFDLGAADGDGDTYTLDDELTVSLQAGGIVEGVVLEAAALADGDDGVVIAGGIGDDTLLGGTGDDLIFGGEGSDVLDGAAGTDSLTGGDGSDVFILRAANATLSLDLADLVIDFEIGTDSLGLADDLLASDIAVGATPGGDAVLFLQSSGTYLAVLQGISQAEADLESVTVVV